jgi:predicted amidohydrolase YtcJ
MVLDLMEVTSWDQIVKMVEEEVKSKKPGDWILGRGWHQEKWESVPEPNIEGLPIHDSLSKVSPQNPVLLTHASGHASYANQKAMDLAGINKGTQAPEGGEIVRDKQGNPIGVFRETAQGLLRSAMSKDKSSLSDEERTTELRKVLQLAAQECLANGITSFHDAGTSFSTIEVMKTLIDEGEMPVRLYVMLSEGNSQLEERAADFKIINYGDNRLTVRSIKRLIDGALGPHGAWLLEPYSDLPTSTGLNTLSIESMKETARIAAENGFQLCTHAIGDRANREVLDIYEAELSRHPELKDHRWRIEHAQHIDPADIPRFAQLNVIAAMQGIHATSDGPWVYIRLGRERARKGAYVWRKLMDSGVLVANGTDAPVERVSPIASYYASVTRKLKDGSIFFGDQCMNREEALRSYTINNAIAAFEEDIKGTLTPGKLADITILSKDILSIPEDEIPTTDVLYTIVGGKTEYRMN